jgi:surfeit locus 1 family protein
VTRIVLSNRHLEYAITWYGIALTLVGVYLAFAVNRLQGSPTE